MTDVDSDDRKYITFKRETFYEMLSGLRPQSFEQFELVDAVVIRRRDKFASPCLATYANMIAMVADNIDDKEVAKDLLGIADYFDRQANLAADEGWKLPDR